MITAIDPRSVDQITSGQVIVSMPNAIKELVENSLDAGATVVEVKANNYCIDGFTVQDNGTGIAEADFAIVAKKHTTSKLSSFGDLDSIATLGFRGEALASLCALATVEITTSTGSGGHYLRFSSVGEVIEQKEVPSPKGTLVSVTNLFSTAPVRRKDFVAHAKREWQKMISMIQVYGLISPVRLTIDNTVKSKKTSSLRCQGDTLEKRIAAVYGNIAARTIMPVKLSLSDCEVVGTISEPTFGKGRTGSDRQLIFVNGRPSDQTKIARNITEIYQLYNHTEVPSFVLDFKLKPSLYDVNVSPDKRTLLLHDEGELIGQLREAFAELFDNTTHTVPRSVASEPLAKKPKRQTLLSLNHLAGTGSVIRQGESSDEEMDLSPPPRAQSPPKQDTADVSASQSPEIVIPIERAATRQRPASIDSNLKITGFMPASELPLRPEEPQDTASAAPRRASPEERPRLPVEQQRAPRPVSNVDLPSVPSHFTHKVAAYPSRPVSAPTQSVRVESPHPELMEDDVPDLRPPQSVPQSVPQLTPQSAPHSVAHPGPGPGLVSEPFPQPVFEPGKDLAKDAAKEPAEPHACCDHGLEPASSSQPAAQIKPETKPESKSEIKSESALNCHITLPTSLTEIKAALAQVQPRKTNRFKHYAIDQDDVERQLTLSVHKEDFADMRIIGQFNLGFIVVVKSTANTDDIFVIDQHASDEIFNFERLQSTTVLNRQPLVVPQVLELSVMEELTVANHMDVFENNGFGITLKTDEPPGKQCRLTALPFSKDTIFTDKDIHELLYKIQENPSDKGIKCAKLRAMHAMRACRKSIMIGRPLTRNQMRDVVTNLGTLHRPWNCPHGRPTLRHITRLS